LDKSKFLDQYHSFQNKGYAQNPSDGAIAIYTGNTREEHEKSRKQKRRELKKNREA
jgi:hypothetical protein